MLAASSEYFRVMFTSRSMKESMERDVSLTGVTAEALSLVLDYVYTSKVTLSLANVQQALAAATHLRFERVVTACSVYLQDQIDSVNCVDVATLADNYCLQTLKSRAFR